MPERIDAELAPRGDGVGSSYAFVERLFVVALRNAVERFQAEPKRWRRILHFLEQDEIDLVARVFAARPPTIRAGYGTAQDPMPLVTVALMQERPDQEVLGDILEPETDYDEFEHGKAELLGAIYEQTIEITIYADHPDVALYLYHWARYGLQAHLDWFLRHGLIEPRFVSGSEVRPDPRFVPERLFCRTLTWTVRGEAVSAEPLPPPPRSLSIFLQGVTVEGHPGRVDPTLAHTEEVGD